MKPTSLNNKTLFIDLDAEIAALNAANPSPSRGDVCRMPVPFSDGSGAKVRGALVLGHHGCNLVVAPLTRHAPRDEFDIEISPCYESGFREESTVRCSQINLISRVRVLCILGYLRPEDLHRVLDTTTLWFKRIVISP